MLQINKPAAFTVDFNGAQGKLDAHVIAPSGTEDQAIIQEVDKGVDVVCFVSTKYLVNNSRYWLVSPAAS